MTPICKCCWIGCEALAVVEIWDDTTGLNTHACGDHVEALIPDGAYWIHRFRIPGDSDTISEMSDEEIAAAKQRA